jgi:hypothetical protein
LIQQNWKALGKSIISRAFSETLRYFKLFKNTLKKARNFPIKKLHQPTPKKTLTAKNDTSETMKNRLAQQQKNPANLYCEPKKLSLIFRSK